jgi:hypothetical protein
LALTPYPRALTAMSSVQTRQAALDKGQTQKKQDKPRLPRLRVVRGVPGKVYEDESAGCDEV